MPTITQDILDFAGSGKLSLSGDVRVEASVRRIIVGVLECARGTRLIVESPFLLVRAGALRCEDLHIIWKETPPQLAPAKATDGGHGADGADGNNTAGYQREGGKGGNGIKGISGTHGVNGRAAPSVAVAYARKWAYYPPTDWVPPTLPDPPDLSGMPSMTNLPYWIPTHSFGRVTFSLTGQTGSPGQDAGDGGTGGTGGTGARAVYREYALGASPWGAPGGPAGTGGDGGMGGCGGSGGPGGSVFIMQEAPARFVSPQEGLVTPHVLNIGGPAGHVGLGGKGSEAGEPGHGGADENGYGNREDSATGLRARPGREGLHGEPGEHGAMGSVVTRTFDYRRLAPQVPADCYPLGPMAIDFHRDAISQEFLTFGL